MSRFCDVLLCMSPWPLTILQIVQGHFFKVILLCVTLTFTQSLHHFFNSSRSFSQGHCVKYSMLYRVVEVCLCMPLESGYQWICSICGCLNSRATLFVNDLYEVWSCIVFKCVCFDLNAMYKGCVFLSVSFFPIFQRAQLRSLKCELPTHKSMRWFAFPVAI